MTNEEIQEIFKSIGPVRTPRFWGGRAVFLNRVLIAVVSEGVVYLRTDEQTEQLFERAGSRRWNYVAPPDRPTSMAYWIYWTIPGEAEGDPDQLARWVKLAHEAGMRDSKWYLDEP